MEGTNNKETFLYGDTDIHHVSSEEKMILYNDCDEKYRTIVPSFLFDNSLRTEAEGYFDGTRCCAVIPEELKSIGDFLYKERFEQKRHVYVYKSILYLLCDALRVEKTYHEDDVTFPQLRRAIIQWWYIHCYLNLVTNYVNDAWRSFDIYYHELMKKNLAYETVDLDLTNVTKYLTEQFEEVNNDEPREMLLSPKDMISKLRSWKGMTYEGHKHQKKVKTCHLKSFILRCRGLSKFKMFETVNLNISFNHIMVSKDGSDDHGFIGHENFVLFFSHCTSNHYKELIYIESFVQKVHKDIDEVDIKISFYSFKYDVDDENFKELKRTMNRKWKKIVEESNFQKTL